MGTILGSHFWTMFALLVTAGMLVTGLLTVLCEMCFDHLLRAYRAAHRGR